ncbi:hypothetical protein RUM43_009218 [Polyplax serrata]|uniref:Homeobox domain-containing protein n=1 Tax=Polyplax serrata TaxID=468196 RepID=A0AAN8NPZ3_POLSC
MRSFTSYERIQKSPNILHNTRFSFRFFINKSLKQTIYISVKVWFKNRRAKCRQQQKQQQQQQQQTQNGSDKSTRSSSSTKHQKSVTSISSSLSVTQCNKTSTPPITTVNNNNSSNNNNNTSTSSSASSPAVVTQRDSPGYAIKPILGGSPSTATNSTYSTNNVIWSPASIEPCLERSSYSSVSQANCYPHQNYGSYYTNMDYLGSPSAMTHTQLNATYQLTNRFRREREREAILLSTSHFHGHTTICSIIPAKREKPDS